MNKLFLILSFCYLALCHASDHQIFQFLKMQENANAIPADLLRAVSNVESGRYMGGRLVPWPWTINVEGKGYMFKTKHEAIKAVEKHQRQGAKSIDIGVMQINLRHHPFAFRNLEEAFDPQLNIAYGAKFLKQLFAQHKSWNAAIGHYHSASPKFHNIYKNKVLNNWFGLGKNKNVDTHHLSKALMNADEIPANDTKPLKRHGVKINHAEPYARLKRVYYPLDNSSSAPLPVNERRKSYTIKNISARHYYALD